MYSTVCLKQGQPLPDKLSMNGVTYRCDNPLARVDSTVPDDGRLDTRAIFTPEVNALDRAALQRLAGDEGLRVPDEGGLEIIEEVEVLLEDVVRVEVGKVRETSASVPLLGLAYNWTSALTSFAVVRRMSN
jgi:hypothetical protein